MMDEEAAQCSGHPWHDEAIWFHRLFFCWNSPSSEKKRHVYKSQRTRYPLLFYLRV